MTTGRINQVTILTSIRHCLSNETPKLIRAEQFSWQEGAIKHPSASGSLERRLQQVPTGYPIAPTEFPKRRSAVQLFQRKMPLQRIASAPQEEDTFY